MPWAVIHETEPYAVGGFPDAEAAERWRLSRRNPAEWVTIQLQPRAEPERPTPPATVGLMAWVFGALARFFDWLLAGCAIHDWDGDGRCRGCGRCRSE